MGCIPFFPTCLLAGSLMLTVSCTPKVVQEPISGPSAEVRFSIYTNDLDDISLAVQNDTVWQYDDIGCQSNKRFVTKLSNHWALRDTPHRLGIPGADAFEPNMAQELRVNAGKASHYLFVAQLHYRGLIYRCGVPFSLNPEPGQQLEASFEIPLIRNCTVKVSEITGGDQKTAQRREIAVYTNHVSSERKTCVDAYHDLYSLF